MSKHRNQMLFAASLLVLGFSWLWFFQRKPKYHGRSLAQWLDLAHANDADATVIGEVNAAIQIIGTNELPRLAGRIAFDVNRCLPQKLISVLPNGVTPQRLTDYLFETKWKLDYKATEAQEIFRILGPQGAPAIPDLTKIAIDRPFVPAHRAVDCLGYIGEPAIPALIMVATNPQPQSFRAFGWLAGFTNSPEAARFVAQYSREPSFKAQASIYLDAFLTNTP